MAAAAYNPNTETTAETLVRGRFQIYRDGQPQGEPFTFLDLATGVVLHGRQVDPTSTYTLVNARTGVRVACDDAELQQLLLDHEPAEEAGPALECGDCWSTEETVTLSRGRVICPGCRAELETRIGPTVAA